MMIGRKTPHVYPDFGDNHFGCLSSNPWNCVQPLHCCFKRAAIFLDLGIKVFNRFIQAIDLVEQFLQNEAMMGLNSTQKGLGYIMKILEQSITIWRCSMSAKRQALKEEKNAVAKKHSQADHSPLVQPKTAALGETVRQIEGSPKAVSAQAVQQLQRAVGNQAVSHLIHQAAQSGGSIQRLYVDVSGHYNNDRDEAHAKAKTALEAADGDLSISKKIFAKHKAEYNKAQKDKRKPKAKCVTTFKTSKGGYLITVTYADVKAQNLTYDKAFLSKNVVSTPESSVISFNPTSPVITVS